MTFRLKKSVKQLMSNSWISGKLRCAERKGVRLAKKRLAWGWRYTLSMICVGVSPVCSRNMLQMFSGSWCFRQSPANRLPNTAPLPSSPRMYPKGDTLAVIFSPLYSHEFDPVPKMQAMPGSLSHSERAAPSKSLCTSMSASEKRTCNASFTRMDFSGVHPAP